MSRLDVSGNAIGDDGAYSIGKCIGKVQNLGLNRCKISKDALVQFSKRIKSLEESVSLLYSFPHRHPTFIFRLLGAFSSMVRARAVHFLAIYQLCTKNTLRIRSLSL